MPNSDFHTTIHGEPWDGIERRKRTEPHDSYDERRAQHDVHTPGAPITREYLDEALSDWRHSSREYFNTHFQRLEELIRDGFPDGDPSQHRRVHEGYIEKAKNRSEMWQAVMKQVLSGSVWAGLMAIGTGLWVVFKQEVKK